MQRSTENTVVSNNFYFADFPNGSRSLRRAIHLLRFALDFLVLAINRI